VTNEERANRVAKPRAYKWRYGPLRLVMPWLAIGGGVVMTIRGALGLTENADLFFLILGVSLIVLGIAAFFVYRWMAKRGF
jgi:hypothetical protein